MFETITNQTSNNNSHETKKKQKVTIHLTGFGPFAGVKENPTTLIIETLKNENFALSSPITNNDYEINPIHYSIIETSMKAVQQYFEEMKCNSGGGDDDSKYPSIDIFIHFGVSGNSIMYELEGMVMCDIYFKSIIIYSFCQYQLISIDDDSYDAHLNSFIQFKIDNNLIFL